jgi:hypothetical protein
MERRRDRVRSFIIGGLVGASAVAAAVRRSRRRPPRVPAAGLAAFEEAPCYEEAVEREREAAEQRR